MGPLTVTDAAGLTINGGQESITVSGDGKIQVFSESKDAKLALENLTVADGFAVRTPSSPPTQPEYGGGIENDGGTLTVTRSTISGNNANAGGGIANIDGGTLVVTNSTFSGNAGVEDGGIVNDGTLTVTNSTFSGNAADLGGGIQNSFVGTATVTLSNTILANSKGPNPLNCRGKITDGGYNISDDSSCAFTDSTSKNSTDPLLDPNGLQDNGGPTQTIALQKGSPALDYIPKGQNGCGTTITMDQRGVTRPQGTACDVGAYEATGAVAQPQPEPPTITCTGGVCLGTEGPDLILGTDSFDLILARGGADGVNAQGGNDLVFGGPGDDSPGGSPSGHDPAYHLEGGAGDDLVFGEAGKDSVTDVFGPFTGFPADRDLLFGGADNDILNGLDGDNLDYLDCGAGEDNVYMADPGDTVLANCQRNIGPQ